MTAKVTTLKALIAQFTKLEKREDLATIVNDDPGIRLLKAWSSVVPKWVRPRTIQPEDLPDLWVWMWSGVRFPIDDLASAAGLDKEQSHELLRRVMFARIAYPDGTISKHATKLIADYVRARYPGQKHGGGRPRGSKDKTKRKTSAKDDDDKE